MSKQLAVPIGVAAVGFIAGGIMLGSLGVSADDQDGFRKFGKEKGHRGEVVAEVLDVSVDELRGVKGSGVTFEEFVLENGFATIDEFHDAVEDYLTTQWKEDGLSDEEIAERVARMEERHELKDAMREATAELLGLSIDELQEARGDHDSMEELFEAAGYEDKEAFHEAVKAELEADGYDTDNLFGKKGGHHKGGGFRR